jgi:hypothetical protein
MNIPRAGRGLSIFQEDAQQKQTFRRPEGSFPPAPYSCKEWENARVREVLYMATWRCPLGWCPSSYHMIGWCKSTSYRNVCIVASMLESSRSRLRHPCTGIDILGAARDRANELQINRMVPRENVLDIGCLALPDRSAHSGFGFWEQRARFHVPEVRTTAGSVDSHI